MLWASESLLRRHVYPSALFTVSLESNTKSLNRHVEVDIAEKKEGRLAVLCQLIF